jgi:hypothetical protein
VKTLAAISAELAAAGLALGPRQLARNMKALGIGRAGPVRTRPALYPEDTAQRILRGRGLGHAVKAGRPA